MTAIRAWLVGVVVVLMALTLLGAITEPTPTTQYAINVVLHAVAVVFGMVSAIWPSWSTWIIILLLVIAWRLYALYAVIDKLNWIGYLIQKQTQLIYAQKMFPEDWVDHLDV